MIHPILRLSLTALLSLFIIGTVYYLFFVNNELFDYRSIKSIRNEIHAQIALVFIVVASVMVLLLNYRK